jgi:acyl-coenzyme A thioesterase PaaI-like protein
MVEPIIEHGVKPSFGGVDEEGVLVDTVSLSPMRDEVTRKSGDGRYTEYVRMEDPRLEIEIKGRPRRNGQGNAHGLGNVHPGVALDLLNVADGANIHGFDISDDNVTIIGNPKRDWSDTDGTQVTVPAVYRPFIAKPVVTP